MKADNKPYDTAFKDLAEQDAEALLRLLGALPPGATVRALPREVSAPALLPDQPYEITAGEDKRIAHLEAQTRYENDVPLRLVGYDVLLWHRYRLPVDSYVLVFIPDGLPEDVATTVTVEAGGLRITVSFTLVRLWQISAADVLATGRENLLPFIPLMAGGETELAAGAKALGQVQDEVRQRELAFHFLALGGLRYTHDEILELIGRESMIPLETLKESSFYQYILAEGREEGREEGRGEAHEKDRAAFAELCAYLAAKRFPSIEWQAELARVRDIAALKQLCIELDQLPTPAALRQRITDLMER